jgi:hypothetical protein
LHTASKRSHSSRAHGGAEADLAEHADPGVVRGGGGGEEVVVEGHSVDGLVVDTVLGQHADGGVVAQGGGQHGVVVGLAGQRDDLSGIESLAQPRHAGLEKRLLGDKEQGLVPVRHPHRHLSQSHIPVGSQAYQLQDPPDGASGPGEQNRAASPAPLLGAAPQGPAVRRARSLPMVSHISSVCLDEVVG